MDFPTRRKRQAPKPTRQVYPLDITGLSSLITKAKRRTKITSKAQLLQLAIARGLPILEKQLKARAAA